MSAPAETLTIVFTDLVDSTATRTTLGEDEADRLSDAHFALLTDVVERFHGRVVKGTGDGVLAVFDSAVDALTAAGEVQRRCERYTRSPTAIAPMHVRIGMSTGDITWDANDDIAGAPAVEAKRLEAAAQPGQILVAELTKLTCRGRGDHTFASVGELDLKGFDQPVHAYALAWERTAPRVAIPLAPHLAKPVDNFVGRADEREILRVHLDASTPQQQRLVNVEGESGMGKTTLVAVACQVAHAEGRTVLFGRCDRELGVPYRPFVEALEDWARSVDPRTIDTSHRLLGHLSPTIAGVLGPPSPTEQGQLAAQLALFESVRKWCADIEPVLVVDDLQWATEPTVLLLRHLVNSGDNNATAIVATTRTTEQPTYLREFLSDAWSRQTATTIELPGLTDQEITALIGTSADSGLGARTRGNPLFLLVLGSDSDGETRSIEAAVERRVHGTPDAVREVLQTASVIGLDFDARVLGDSLESDGDVLDLLETAVAHGLIEEQSINRFSFSHGLVQEVLFAGIGRSRRARMHLRVAESIRSHDPDAHTQLARHFDAAGAAREAIPYLERAAGEADRAGDLAGSIRLHGRLSALHEDGVEVIRHDLGVLMARIAGGDGSEELIAAVLDCIDRSAQPGNDEIWLEAIWALFCASLVSGADHDMATVFGSLVDRRFVDADRRLLANALVAYTTFMSGEPALGRAILESVAELLPFASPRTALIFHQGIVFMAQRPIDLPKALEASARMRDLQATDNSIMVGFWLVQICAPLITAGRIDEVADVIATFRRQHPYLPPFTSVRTDSCYVMYLVASGRFDEASALLDDMDERGRDLPDIQGTSLNAIQRFMVSRELGTLGTFAPVMKQIAELDPENSRIWRPGLLAMFSELGMIDDARRELRASMARGMHFRDDERPEYTTTLGMLAEGAIACHDVKAAEQIHSRLAPYAGQHLTNGHGIYFGPVSRILGRLAEVRGDDGGAEAMFRQAIDESVRAPTPVYEARSRVDLADLLDRLGRSEGQHQALMGGDTAGALGMARVQARANAILGRHL